MGLRSLSALQEYILIGVERHSNPRRRPDQKSGGADSGQCHRDFTRIDGEPGALQHCTSPLIAR